ncbi:hypothetical protein FOZ62_015989, partial [Perkinsus olseni]
MEEYCQDEAAEEHTAGSPPISSKDCAAAANWADKKGKREPGQKEVIYVDDAMENYLVVSESLAAVVPTQEQLDEIVTQYYQRLHGLPCPTWKDFIEYKTVIQNVYLVKRHEGFCCTCYNGRSPPCIHAIALQYLEDRSVGGFKINELLTYGPKPRGRPKHSAKKALQIDEEYVARLREIEDQRTKGNAASPPYPQNARRLLDFGRK